MANVQPGFGFICGIGGGKVTLEKPWTQTNEISKI